MIEKAWQFPYIPFSELKVWREKAKNYLREGGFDEKTLWHLLVSNEINQLWAEYWHDEIEKARNYKGIEGYSCPLCVYGNGKFIAHCSMHREIEELRRENYILRKKIGYDDYPGPERTTLTREEWDEAYLGDYRGGDPK